LKYEGHKPFQVKELIIGERSAKRPKLPEHIQNIPADSSRLLKAAARKNQERKESHLPVVSYRSVWKEAGKDV
jgi:putative transposase